jgi:hypothetical protein
MKPLRATKATGLAVHRLEMDSPLSPAETSVIEASFKPQYVPQIECWALVQTGNRKRKLFDFLACKEPKIPTRSTTSLSTTTHSDRDFLLQTPSCQINFSFAFQSRPVTRQNNVQRFASPGCTQVFHEALPPSQSAQSSSADHETIATWIIRKLMNPQAVAKYKGIANANLNLLQELSLWVERRNTNPFPVDRLLQHPTLSPYSQSTANHEKNHEDHLARPNVPPLPYMVQSKSDRGHPEWRTPCTAYTSFFDDNERFSRSYLSGPFPPFERSQPFSKFPHGVPHAVRPPPSEDWDPVFVRQAADDTRINRNYKTIFQSKTCL